MTATTSNPDKIIASLKKAAGVLADADVPFALGGGLAMWSYGGPASSHDVDLMLREQDAKRAQQALVDAGMRAEDPPEDWLLKVYDDDVLIDLVFRPVNTPVTDDVLDRSEERDVEAVRMKVLSLEDGFVYKLLAIDEHYLDYENLVSDARAVREQVDWAQVRERTRESPFSRAFFVLLEDLGVLVPAPD